MTRNGKRARGRDGGPTFTWWALRMRPSMRKVRAPSGPRAAATSWASLRPRASWTRTSHSCRAGAAGCGVSDGARAEVHAAAQAGQHATNSCRMGPRRRPRMHAMQHMCACVPPGPTWASLSVDTTSRSARARMVEAGAPSAKQTASSSALLPLPLGPRMQVRLPPAPPPLPAALMAPPSKANCAGAAPPYDLNARTLAPCKGSMGGRHAARMLSGSTPCRAATPLCTQSHVLQHCAAATAKAALRNTDLQPPTPVGRRHCQ